MQIKAEKHLIGRTIKSVLAELKFSAKTVSGLKRLEDGILVNGEHKTVRYILEEGDILSLKVEDTSSSSIIPKALPIKILYEDKWLLFVNKPPFLPVHPSRHHQDDTLAARVINYFLPSPFIFRCVTRLDADTSGVVMIAKDKITSSIMSDMIAKRLIKKEYTAICQGTTLQSGTIDFNIKRPNPTKMLRCACPHCEAGNEGSPEGALAITHYTRLADNSFYSLLRLFPETGRTHQIRVHLSAIGNPIVADKLYGSESALINRHALHASSLSFNHPYLGRELKINAPLFDDMSSLAVSLFGGRKEVLID